MNRTQYLKLTAILVVVFVTVPYINCGLAFGCDPFTDVTWWW